MATKQYDKWKDAHSFNTLKGNKEQYEAIKKVRDELDNAKRSRQTNCYWYTGSATGDDSGGGGDWNRKWEDQEKAWLMWYKPSSSDDFKSNIKLPETTGRIEAIMNRIRRVQLGWNAFPNDKGDVGKAKIAELVMDHVFYKAQLNPSIASWTKNALIHGSGHARFIYQRQRRKGKFPKYRGLDKDEKEKVKEGKVIFGKEQEYSKYEGFSLIVIPNEEFYPDPQALSLHGNNKAARFAIWRRLIHIDDFKSEFTDDPNAINVDKVKPVGNYSGSAYEDYEFFRPPSDVVDNDMVEVLEYENVNDDEYIVVANDILIKQIPLPYNHKELTFHKIDCIEHPNQYYGIGIPDFLTNLQGAAEIMINMMLDKMYRNMNTKMAVEAGVYGAFTDGYARADNQIIPIPSNDGRPMSAKIMTLPSEPFGFETFNILGILREYATMATQIDPSQMALQVKNNTATATAINKELVETMIASVLDNMGNSFITVGQQMWSTIREKMGVQKVKEIVGEDGSIQKESIPWTIRVEGKEVVFEDNDIKISDTDERFSFVEIKDEYLKTASELDIRISPDSMRILSKAQEMQKVMEAYAQMMPNAVDPNDNEKIRMHPLPLYDARKLAAQLVNVMSMEDNILLDPTAGQEQDLEAAKQHVISIMAGEDIPGKPGMSDLHKQVESEALTAINNQVETLYGIMENQARENLVYDPMTGMPVPQIDPELEKQYNELREKQAILAKHLEIDNMPKYMTEEAAMGGAAESQQRGIPMPPGGGGQMPPQMGMDPQMMGGGMMPPQQGIPMPEEVSMQQMMPNYGGQI